MSEIIKEFEKRLRKLDRYDYTTIDRLMKELKAETGISLKKLHYEFVDKHGESPDSWIKRKRGLQDKKTTSCGCNEEFKPTPSIENVAAKHGVSVDVIKAQLKKGIKVEKEHTKLSSVAEKIALQHLDEFPDYYDRLRRIEKKTFREFVEDIRGSKAL